MTFVALRRIIDVEQIKMDSLATDIFIRCQRGDRDAFRVVVQTYQRLVFSLAIKMLADEDDAKDIVQETFIRVWQGIDSYDVRRPFSTWIYTITSRLCLDRIKSMRRTATLPTDEYSLRQFASDSDNERSLENSEYVSIVKILTEKLSPKQRLVFTLCQLEGLSSDEVEQIAGLNARQVKSNLYEARQTIREQLKHLGYE